MPLVDLPPLWPHQAYGLEEIEEAQMIRERKKIAVTSPTGGGKSRMMVELILRKRRRVAVYSNRRMLTEQLARVLERAGISFGVRAAGTKPRLLEDVQLSSLQTEHERVYQTGQWSLHDAALVIVDEAHAQKAEVAGRIVQDHVAAGAELVVGFSATPVGLDHIYEELITAGTVSELRACGALVPAITYAPDEPGALIDRKTKEPLSDEELTEPKVAKAMKAAVLFGRVFEHWRALNPHGLPTIGFAPDVAGSLYFAEQFEAAGVPAAHIDGKDIWIRGKWYEATQKARDYLRDEMLSGAVRIAWNRFVLREGIDWPFLYHGIFATAFGSLSSYLQAGGRLLRQHYVNGRPQFKHVIIQDHGGNWWRHGSLNDDREWSIDYSERIFQSLRRKRLREKSEPEPIRCKRCYSCRRWGRECPQCGFIQRTRSRVVLESDGKLREVSGDIYKPRRVAPTTPLVEKKWESMFWRARKTGRMTFDQARALYAYENRWQWPDESLWYMPTREIDWFRLVSEVPLEALTSVPERYLHAPEQTSLLEDSIV